MCRSGCIQLKASLDGRPQYDKLGQGYAQQGVAAVVWHTHARCEHPGLCIAWLPVQSMLGVDKEQGIFAIWRCSLPLPEAGGDCV